MPRKWLDVFILFFLSTLVIKASLVEDVRRSFAASAPFRVEFRQKMMNGEQAEFEETGFFLYNSPEQMKWVYQQPEEKIFIVNGRQLKFYDPVENQLMVGEVRNQKNQWLWQILLTDVPEITVEEHADKRTISFHHRLEEITFTVFLGEDNLPVKVVQADAIGYQYHYLFTGYQAHCHLGKTDFEMDLPQDVEIIEME